MLVSETGTDLGDALGQLGGKAFEKVIESPAALGAIEGAVVASLDSPAVQSAIVRATRPVLAQAALFIGGAVLIALIIGRS